MKTSNIKIEAKSKKCIMIKSKYHNYYDEK